MAKKKNKYFRHKTALIGKKAKIGEHTRIWAFTNIQDDTVIGSHCNICDACFIEKGVRIGNHVTLKNGISVFEGITIQDGVFCGSNVTFINDRYPRSRKNPWVLEKTLIKHDATIGSNATILCGVTIGEYAMVGAGTVVTKSVPAYRIVLGNPGRVKGYACRCGKKLNSLLKCSCGLSYALAKQSLKLK